MISHRAERRAWRACCKIPAALRCDLPASSRLRRGRVVAGDDHSAQIAPGQRPAVRKLLGTEGVSGSACLRHVTLAQAATWVMHASRPADPARAQPAHRREKVLDISQYPPE